jgi:hypothetical protein
MTSISCGRHRGALQRWRQEFKIKDFQRTTLSSRPPTIIWLSHRLDCARRMSSAQEPRRLM